MSLAAPSTPKRIAMLAFPDVQVLDVMGPLEVFSRGSRCWQDAGKSSGPVYTVEIIGITPGPFQTSSGLTLHAEYGFENVPAGIDTLMIAGGKGVAHYRRHEALQDWLRRQVLQVRRLASICTGAFLLADSGLLSGKRATTHWHHCAEFARQFPDIALEPEPIFVRDGSIYSSGGVTAGMDLALALVEEDFGRELALETARQLVMFVQRPGGQAQFSAQLSVQLAEQVPLRDLQNYILEHPEADLSIETLARKVAMSPRNFARQFKAEVGQTPAKFVSTARIETARRLLESSERSISEICARSGLGSIESMRRVFVQTIGIAPGQYRERFQRPAQN